MDILFISDQRASHISDADALNLKDNGFLWLDATLAEVTADVPAWRAAVERITGTELHDLHVSDAINIRHPSYFDSTRDYEMVVFRKLALAQEADAEAVRHAEPGAEARRKIPPALTRLATQPVTFLVMDRALVTVHGEPGRTIAQARKRLLDYEFKAGASHASRPPASPRELMLRLLNAMVDQYLELRQPLTTQIDRWQRALLNPRRPFNDWTALLDARIELRKLDLLCEEQHDALQELRDHFVDTWHASENGHAKDVLLVRINDVMEHVARVLNHARRLEASIESAVQIHFSAMAHRTSEIMRTLTVLTALFMPLTLITGIFGMNFIEMPLLKHHDGFWIIMGMMAATVAVALLIFRRKRFLEDRNADS
ncbi:magnesium transporter CorA family protein [Janthinobacterium sp. 17J80-10]|uniref:magnesium transporter CorA family protein n=1 Tax=Janthinobacterium sp. 17J80-10 TaxID=2497863 RepID=UPI0010053323|nr:magnesium transporter CorA family protein [Janthinobacterium sp. 17J80-10]QAU35870.1 magnesium transporter [Janthinobacterium sp. 17J80-10]